MKLNISLYLYKHCHKNSNKHWLSLVPFSAVIDDRRSFTDSSILSWIDTAESLYSTLGGKTQWSRKNSPTKSSLWKVLGPHAVRGSQVEGQLLWYESRVAVQLSCNSHLYQKFSFGECTLVFLQTIVNKLYFTHKFFFKGKKLPKLFLGRT